MKDRGTEVLRKLEDESEKVSGNVESKGNKLLRQRTNQKDVNLD